MQLKLNLLGTLTYNVSILIRPEGRMQPGVGELQPVPSAVSILIRPEGRMQRG